MKEGRWSSSHQDVLDAVHQALERDRLLRPHNAEIVIRRECFPREQQVLPMSGVA